MIPTLHIINYFTSMKYFEIDTLNLRKPNVDYGLKVIENISPKIEMVHLKKK